MHASRSPPSHIGQVQRSTFVTTTIHHDCTASFPTTSHPSIHMNPTHDRYPKDGHIRDDDDDEFDKESPYVAEKRLPEPRLLDLDLPHSELDLTMTFDSILSEGVSHFTPEEQKVQKRASNVLKLSQENDKLQEELRAMTERLEAAERKQRELAQKNQSRGASASSPSS